MKQIKLLSQQEIIKRINRNTRASYHLFDQLLLRLPVFSPNDHHDSDHIERRLSERGESNKK